MGRFGSWQISWAPSARGPRRSPGTSTPTNENGPRRIPANTPARRCAAPGTHERGQRAARTRFCPSRGRTSRPGGWPSWPPWATTTGTFLSALIPTPVGDLDRAQAVERVLARLAAARSAWNAADVRGQVEQLLAAAGIITDPAVRIELAEDLTARTLSRCVPLLDRDGLPEHIRAWASGPVLAVEADLTARLAARATDRSAGVPDIDLTAPSGDLTAPVELAGGAGRLDPGQAAAVAALAGGQRLVVLEGAAGAG